MVFQFIQNGIAYLHTKEYLLQLISKDDENFQHLHKNLKESKVFCLGAIKENSKVYKHIVQAIKEDGEVFDKLFPCQPREGRNRTYKKCVFLREVKMNTDDQNIALIKYLLELENDFTKDRNVFLSYIKANTDEQNTALTRYLLETDKKFLLRVINENTEEENIKLINYLSRKHNHYGLTYTELPEFFLEAVEKKPEIFNFLNQELKQDIMEAKSKYKNDSQAKEEPQNIQAQPGLGEEVYHKKPPQRIKNQSIMPAKPLLAKPLLAKPQ